MEPVQSFTEPLQEILFREIHHRFFNSLQILSAMLGRLMLLEGAGETVTMVRDHIAILADMHRSLSQPGGGAEHLQRLLHRLPEAFNRSDVVMLVNWADPVDDPIVARGLTLIVVELVTNALKHGRRVGPLTISISLDRCSQGYRLIVDNEVEPEAQVATAVPLIARQLCQALGGELRVDAAKTYQVQTIVPATLPT